MALVGRPNVGKSTLFNQLTRSRDALVADYPGLTRDRRYGRCSRGERDFLVIDTGGIDEAGEIVNEASLRQVSLALDEADLVLFLVDGRDGLTAADEDIAEMLRRRGLPILMVINKIDGEDPALAAAEFSGLGFEDPVMIAAAHGRGVTRLVEKIERCLPPSPEPEENETEGAIRVAVIGRPNVGKSTLINRLLGEERVVVADHPGTTRDAIEIPFERDGERFVLIDTAGIRRRARVEEAVEKLSVIKAIQAMEEAHVVVFLLDCREGVTDQDARLLGMVIESGRALVIGLNKWDGLPREQKRKVRDQLEIRLRFVDFADKLTLSALHGTGVGDLFDRIVPIYRQALSEFSTSQLTRILQQAVEGYPPPLVRGRRIKLKFAHQGGKNPPLIVIHGNQTERIPAGYRRYLNHTFRDLLRLKGTPVRLEFRSSENPFAGRYNKLTERQIHKRRRLIKHAKKRR